jgi:hypothetical protein
MPPINTGDRKELGKLLQSLAAGDQVVADAHRPAGAIHVRAFRHRPKIIDGGQFLNP